MSRHSQSGTVLVYALIVIAAGAFLLTGWINVLAARAQFTEQSSAALARRTALANSRLLASQYLLQNVLPGSHNGQITAALAGGWAGFTLAGPASGEDAWVPLESVNFSNGVNAFSPGGGEGYTLDIAATLSDGAADFSWLFQARSRSPIFAHDLFTSQRPTTVPSSQIIVSSGFHIAENTVLWRPASPNAFELTAGSYQTPDVISSVSLVDGSGQPLTMSDFAFLPVTSGPAGSAYGYDGSISVVNPAVTGGPNSLVNKVLTSSHIDVDGRLSSEQGGVISDGAGLVTIDLLEPSLNMVYIVGGAATLRLQGQSTADDLVQANDRPSVLIVYLQDASASFDLTTVELQGENNRRVYLAVKKNTGTTVSISPLAAGSPLQWRLAGVFENAPISFSLPGGSLRIYGGLRSDQSVGVAGGSVSFLRENDPKALERYADRIVWLEAFRQ